ncbi:hypothetical protein LP7551_03933 [Roseibium album]|nr:hypothetical protein LP7551_03933 [Roseibium album]
MSIDFNNWAIMSYWTIEEAAQLCCNFEPIEHNYDELDYVPTGLPIGVPPEINRIYKLIERSVLGRALEYSEVSDEGGGVTYGICPHDFLGWCKRVGIDLPIDLENAVQNAKISAELPIGKLPAGNQTNRGGRPIEYDWELFHLEIIGIANTPDGLPERQADLVRRMLQWFLNTQGAEPAESAVKSKISKIYKYLKKAKNLPV